MNMFWKVAFLGAATALYGLQFGILLATGDRAAALIMGGYIVANIGLIWSLL